MALAILAILTVLAGNGQTRTPSPAASGPGPIFAKGQPGPTANFTGKAWLQGLTGQDDKYPCSVGSVQFAPGAHSNWHQHPAGQILLIVEGTGHYQK
ncbi:hypothetical protein I2I05_14540 [Hymenobacter sp. BT683]|uniref:Cupin domain-containing protein n=1 Tax=Hymenobacter jeongseonensis TaxID=2791027 RepID=A0ABS0IJR9_9BACT|nr:hypothetical protein [Hymenobacter jeongseonensis]MBF9238622.1 hypothetical protein [Hymenobacter jeongseonensis]